jgi:hypothetical protein
MRVSIILSALVAGIGIPSATAAEPDELVYVPASTKRVCQLTGDLDRAAGIPTLSRTEKRFGILATDLGSSFEHKGRLYFLFGDTWGRPGCWDAVAWTESTDPEKIILDFHQARDGKWLPPTVPGIALGVRGSKRRCIDRRDHIRSVHHRPLGREGDGTVRAGRIARQRPDLQDALRVVAWQVH